MRPSGDRVRDPEDAVAAARVLEIDPVAVEHLARAGYLRPAHDGVDGLRFATSDLKAFMARNADNGSGNLFLSEPVAVGAGDLLEALDGRCAAVG